MTYEELLSDLEPLTHAQRVGVMVELGRQNDSESQALVSQLERGGFYERSLALYSCFGSRNTDHILRALTDPSHILRGLATQLAALFCDDEQALQGINSSAAPTRLALAHKLHRKRRQIVIDAFLSSKELPNHVLYALLPLATEEVVKRHLTRFSAHATNDNWRRMAGRLPALVFAELEHQVAEAAPHDARLLARVNATLAPLTYSDPDRALALVAVLARVAELESIALEPLVIRRPSETANFILAQPMRESPRRDRTLYQFRGRIGQLAAEQIVGLYRLNPQIFGWSQSWFKDIAPAERPAVLTGLRQQLRTSATLSEEVIAALPESERVQEARANLDLPRLPLAARLRFAAYLPWDEALVELSPSLRAPEVTLRQVALTALIGTVAYHRSQLGSVLMELRERRNEQDPVRRAMFAALRALPASVCSDERLPDLEELIRHGLNDVGLSSQTLQEIVRLLLKLAPSHPDWVGEQLAQALRERGWSSFQISSVGLPPAIEAQLAQSLAPLLTFWASRGDDSATLEATERMFVRPATFTLVAGLVEEILQRTHDRHDAVRALSLLATRARERFGSVVPALLASDPSWYTLPIVAAYLFRRRQDALTPFLSYRTYSGRWGTGRKRILPQLDGQFASGTAHQQEIVAEASLAIVADEEEDSHVVASAIKLLAWLPAVPAERIMPLASDTHPLVRTSALFALARLDTDAGLPALLDALDDARARIAVHALRRFLVVMPTEQALAILRAIPLDRVTVAKEVMRLIGELASDVAYDELLAFERRDLHRDVRIALLRTLDAYLDRAQTWDILERAATSPDKEVALATLSLTNLATADLMAQSGDTTRQRNALRLVAKLLARPEREARMEVLRYCARMGVADTTHEVTPALLESVMAGISQVHTRASYDETFSALNALFGVCPPDDIAETAELTRALLPHRRLLQAATNALSSAPRLRQRGLQPLIRSMVAAMSSDPLTARLRMSLVMPHLPTSDIIRLFADLSQTHALQADDLVWACQRFEARTLRFAVESLITMEDAWRASDDEQLRRLAFAVLQARARRSGEWSEEMMSRLRVYRADPSRLVAAAAQFTFPLGDMPEGDNLN